MSQKSILFVCTGNIFRSLSAEYCLKHYILKKKQKEWNIHSAGIIAKKEPVHNIVFETLNHFGIENVHHTQRKLTKKILDNSDIVIAMAKDHKKFIKSKFGYDKVYLFNELAINYNSSVRDIIFASSKYITNNSLFRKDVRRVIYLIHKRIPLVYKQLHKLMK